MERLRAEVDQLRAYVASIDEGLEPLELMVVDLARMATAYRQALGVLLRDTYGPQRLEQGGDDVAAAYDAVFPPVLSGRGFTYRHTPVIEYERPERRREGLDRDELVAACEAEGVAIPQTGDENEEPDGRWLATVLDQARARRAYPSVVDPPAGLALLVETPAPAS